MGDVFFRSFSPILSHSFLHLFSTVNPSHYLNPIYTELQRSVRSSLNILLEVLTKPSLLFWVFFPAFCQAISPLLFLVLYFLLATHTSQVVFITHIYFHICHSTVTGFAPALSSCSSLFLTFSYPSLFSLFIYLCIYLNYFSFGHTPSFHIPLIHSCFFSYQLFLLHTFSFIIYLSLLFLFMPFSLFIHPSNHPRIYVFN